MRTLALHASLLLIATAAPAAADDTLSRLEGTWYVLVHYRNSLTAKPEATRWLDYVWHFERRGSRLEWTQYPIVVFDSSEGRFERTRAGLSRSVTAWEPAASDWGYLRAGPRVNPRGSKSKKLRGSDETGWSTTRRRGGQSASVFGYQESWSVEGLDGEPVFTLTDVLESATARSAEGKTEYRAEEAKPRELRGSYARDETRRGTFQMWKVGPLRGLVTDDDERSVHERFEQRQRELLERSGGPTAGEAE